VVVVEADTGRRVASLAAAVGVDTVVAFTSTAIWLVFIGQVTVAFVVVAARGGDTENFWGGEEDIGEGGLDTLGGIGCTETAVTGLVEGLLEGVHELYPHFLDGTVLAEVELVVGLGKSADVQDTATNLWTTVTRGVAP